MFNTCIDFSKMTFEDTKLENNFTERVGEVWAIRKNGPTYGTACTIVMTHGWAPANGDPESQIGFDAVVRLHTTEENLLKRYAYAKSWGYAKDYDPENYKFPFPGMIPDPGPGFYVQVDTEKDFLQACLEGHTMPPEANKWEWAHPDEENVGEEYNGLSGGGDYDIYRCPHCKRKTYSELPD